MATLLDLSQTGDPLLGALIGRINAIAGDTPYLLAGATARDLLLQAAHGIDTRRATKDVDLAFLVDTWDEYLDLHARLLASGDFSGLPKDELHKLRFRGDLQVDVLPFGAIERPDRTIAWPPDGDTIMTMFGFREAHQASITVVLPPDERVQVVSLPALAILKFIAWQNRRLEQPGKDAHDLIVILRAYLEAGNEERFYDEADGLIEFDTNFDIELGGAWLLGRDMTSLLDVSGHERIARIIADEADENGQLRLVGDIRAVEPERALQILRALEDGLAGRSIRYE
jgi:predicted nucleotidyltransferase